ncbi:cytoskeletal protein 4.1-like isoform X5 [Fundulus heteroclitus]|uniref:cytoskeletal protein 4.1-like isoform X5 n=1 Tax=Fundulus heteroclitus TaxID=8078 RepID=UPI00165C112F|nr:cytoskeletal protein 4.1-like isoform X5 [Fundulus heteroclitus]
MVTTPDNKSNRPVSAPAMSPVSSGEARPSPLLPTLPQPNHPDSYKPKTQRHADWKMELKTECKPEYTKSRSPKPQSTSEIKDLDKTQTEIMRHHTSISELKRSFMESVPEPQPSEWDKRLSTNSPLHTVSVNGQLQPAEADRTGGGRGGETCGKGSESNPGRPRRGLRPPYMGCATRCNTSAPLNATGTRSKGYWMLLSVRCCDLNNRSNSVC